MKNAHLICSDVGTGLSRHFRLLEEILTGIGYRCERLAPAPYQRGDRAFVEAARRQLRWRRRDLQLFAQDISPRALPFGARNVLLPMQEWFDPNATFMLPAFDSIFCASQHAADIFKPLHHDVRNLQFTSVDRSMSINEGDRTRILHIAGRSPYKGTAQLVRVWQRHPEWPRLTLTHAPGIVPEMHVDNIEQHIGHLPDDQIRRFQNEAWLHVQTSEAEGFGHCLFEAMSCGGAVLTIDAPPMNELFSTEAPEGFLIPFSRREPLNLGYRFFAEDDDLELALSRILERGRRGTREVGEAARARFVSMDRRVRADFADAFVK